jgi:hypothetical protein
MVATDQGIADLCCGIYAYPGEPSVGWSHYEPGGGLTGVCFGVVQADDEDLVIFRGTDNFAEWLDDFDFIAKPTLHSTLNEVHDGFLIGMPGAYTKIKALRRPSKPMRVGGHSLGASRANVLCGLAILDGDVPSGRVVFGEPFTGFASFSDMLSPIPWQSSYCNGDDDGHDLITEVPFPIPPRWPWVRPSPLIHVSQSPPATDHSAFRYHHMQLYRAAPGKRNEGTGG